MGDAESLIDEAERAERLAWSAGCEEDDREALITLALELRDQAQRIAGDDAAV